MLNPPWACVYPASRCAKLCIWQQTLIEVLNSFIAWFSTWRKIHQTGTARKADHSATFQKNRSALKTSLVSSLLFTQAVAGSLQLRTVFSDRRPRDPSLRGSRPFPCLAVHKGPGWLLCSDGSGSHPSAISQEATWFWQRSDPTFPCCVFSPFPFLKLQTSL